jgi:hypothetical protein
MLHQKTKYSLLKKYTCMHMPIVKFVYFKFLKICKGHKKFQESLMWNAFAIPFRKSTSINWKFNVMKMWNFQQC